MSKIKTYLVLVLYSVTVTASAFWLARLTLANRLNWHLHVYTVKLRHVSVIKIHVIYVYMVYLTKMANTERFSCNVYLSVAVVVSKLDVMSLSACPRLSLSLADVIHSFLNEHGWRHWMFTPLSADRIPTGFLVYHNSGQFFRGSHLWYDHREPVRQRLTQQRRRRRVAVTWLDAGTSKRGLSRDPAKQNSPERRDNHHNHFL